MIGDTLQTQMKMSFERAQNITFTPNCWINTAVFAGNFVAPTVFEASFRKA
jgi:hypothetical protein